MEFLGYLKDQEIVEICNMAKEIGKNHSPFLVKLNKICYGPAGKMPPRMIWAVGDSSKEFVSLKKNLIDSDSS